MFSGTDTTEQTLNKKIKKAMKAFLFTMLLLCIGSQVTPFTFSTQSLWYSETFSVSSNTFEIPVATVYWGVEGQTDSSPTTTASMKKFDPINTPRYVALSRDIQKNYNLKFGDVIIVEGPPEIAGEWIFEDYMNKRWCNKIDFLMPIGYMNKYEDIKITVPCETCVETQMCEVVIA